MSLLDLLLSLSLSSLLMLALWQAYALLHDTFHWHLAMTDIQQRGSLASELLTTAIQSAGYFGCQSVAENFGLQRRSGQYPPTIDAQTVLRGFAGAEAHMLDAHLTRSRVMDSDVLMINKLNEYTADLVQAAVNTPVLRLNSDVNIQPQDELVIVDCEQVQITRVKNVMTDATGKQRLEVQDMLSDFAAGSEVGVLQSTIYFIGLTDRFDQHGVSIPALYVHDSRGVQHELIEGVEQMKINYGIRMAGDNIIYQPSSAVVDWSQVVSVTITLLLTSMEDVTRLPVTQTPFAADRKWRKQWQFTTALRERSFV